MKKILTASQMREYDAYTINEIGIPAMVLMERAAYAAYEEIIKYVSDTKRKLSDTKVLLLCGKGNNGGDGLALARLLWVDKVKIQVVMPLGYLGLSPECEKQYSILDKMGIQTGTEVEDTEYDIIVDALFGIGFSRPLEGSLAELMQKINAMDSYRVALDIPSGLCGDNGKALGECFRADMTVTFGYYKRGLLVGDGLLYAGKVVCKDIGVLDAATERITEQAWMIEEDITCLLPYRRPNGNKGTFGKVYIYAGSTDTIGAAILCAKSAFSAGAGMVKVLCPREYQKLFLEQIPEVMLCSYDEAEEPLALENKIKKDLLWSDIVVAGPGIGKTDRATEILQIIFKYAKVPMVLDADALNLLAEDAGLREQMLAGNKEYGRNVILTPHPGELSRLLGMSVCEIKENPFGAAQSVSHMYDSVAVCKDARTIVAYKEKPMYLNLSGNHGMATAGSGDVLAGILGAYAAVYDDPYKAARNAVYFHGLAGDAAAEEVGERALMASHIIEGMIALQKGI